MTIEGFFNDDLPEALDPEPEINMFQVDGLIDGWATNTALAMGICETGENASGAHVDSYHWPAEEDEDEC